MALSPATHLGPYEIVGLVGAGGMGEVYRARDPRLGRDVAVKVLPEEVARDAQRLSFFEREARAVAALNHPNILTVHDVGTHDGVPYVVTELLEGESFRELVSRRTPTVKQILSYALQAARGLEAAHAKDIVHRDLKPENLFLTTDGRVKILDFGLAKLVHREEVDTDAPTPSRSTAAGQVVGTVAYMSPEQARGHPVDARSDVFSFGVVLYELLAGRNPFKRDTMAATLTAIVEEDPTDLASLSRGIPPVVGGVARRCLEKAREERHASGHDVVVALEAVLAAPTGAAALAEVEERSPYPGLSSFTEKDAGVFFGREREVEDLWGRIQNRRLLAVIGPSGTGKTSFVRAGVMASRPQGWKAMVVTPGAQPFRGLGRALGPELAGDTEALGRLADVEDPEVAVGLLGRWRRDGGEGLLVVDQFEELLTLNPPETQERFATLLARIASEADLHILLSLRDDFLIRCCEREPLAPVVEGLTALLALKPADLRRAIEEPAKKRGYRFEDRALVDEMVQAVEGARAALPLLAFAVSRLWERRDRERKVLTRVAYEEVGGVAGALAQHAEATMDRIGSERQGLVRETFRNLVTAQGTRAVIDREELLSAFPDRDAAEDVLDQLIDARLLTSYEVEEKEGEARHHRVEVVHESLLKAWPRLVRWQAQDEEGALLRDQLKQAAHLWEEKERTPDLLWSGTAFREYELWRERYPGKLTAVEEDFSRSMIDRTRRRQRIRRGVVAAAFVALAGVAAAIGVSRQEAVHSARRAESSKLLALAQARLDEDPTEALAFATASLELSDTREARVFAMKALWEAPPALEQETGGLLRVPAFSPDGRWLAVGSLSSEVRVWSEEGGSPLVLPGHLPGPSGTGLSWASEALLVTADGEPTERCYVWMIPGGERVGTIKIGGPSELREELGRTHIPCPPSEARPTLTPSLPKPDTAPEAVFPETSGRWIVNETAEERRARIWGLRSWPAARPLVLRRNASWYAATATFHPTGDWLVASTAYLSNLTFWPLRRAYPTVVDGYSNLYRPLAFAPDGRSLVTSWSDDRLRVWPVGTGMHKPPRPLDLPEGIPMASMAFGPEGRVLLAVGGGNRAYVASLEGGPSRRLESLLDDALLFAAAVSPSGRRAATAFGYGRGEKTLRVWDLGTGELRVFDLPRSELASAREGEPTSGETGYEQAVADLAFVGESILYSSGDGGIRRWNLDDGTHEMVLPGRHGFAANMRIDAGGRAALVRHIEPGRSGECPEIELVDLHAGTSRALPEFGQCLGDEAVALDPSGSVAATGDRDGLVRVGRPGAGEPHLLAGHEGTVSNVAVSPDLKWVASAGEDNTLRLWPMPDLEAPPLHTLPREELLEELKSLTNLRAVQDPESSTAWSIELDRFPGWKEVPVW